MKGTRTGFYRKAVSAVALIFIMSLFAGCAVSSQQKEFETIESNLERGGSFYHVYNVNSSVKELFDEYVKKIDKELNGTGFTEKQRANVRRKLFTARLFLNFLIFDAYRGVGASSRRRPDGIFSNRIFLAANPGVRSLADRVLLVDNSDVRDIAAALPQETFCAAGVNFSIPGLLETIQEYGPLSEVLLAELPQGFPLEIFRDIKGWGIFAMARKAGFPANEDCMMLKLPDPDGKLFDFIARMPFSSADSKHNPARRELALKDPAIGLWAPVMVKGKGSLAVFNSPEAEKLFTNPEKSLLKSEHFIRYAGEKALPASIFGYERQMETNPVFLDDNHLDNIRLDRLRSSFETVRRTETGWLCTGRADLDIPGEIATYFAARQLVKFLDERPDKKVVRSVKNAAKKSNTRSYCRKKFSKVYAALLKYAQQHKGVFPEVSGNAGLQAIQPDVGKRAISRMIYLGGSKPGTADIPLLLDAPGVHRDGFCVMYADGKVKQYKLERPGNCRRMISFLYTVHRWEIKTFQTLMKQAQIIDDASEKKE